MTAPADLDPDVKARMSAALEMLGRTGAAAFELSYDDDLDPIRWTATVTYRGTKLWRTTLHPVTATEALLAEVIDGGACTTCGRPTAVLLHGAIPDGAPLGVCYRYRLGARYVRSCP